MMKDLSVSVVVDEALCNISFAVNDDGSLGDPINKDGTHFNPPENPLKEKWEQNYINRRDGSKCGLQNTMACVLCNSDKCYHNTSLFRIPAEDLVDYTKYLNQLSCYIDVHNL